MFNYLFESSADAPRKLKNIEKTIGLMQNKINSDTSTLVKQLRNQLSDFTGINDIRIQLIDKELNAAAMTIYNKKSGLELVNFFKSIVGESYEDKKVISGKDLKNLKQVKEPATAVQTFYLFIGKPIIKFFLPSEVVAIILHEIGHVFSVTTNTPMIIERIAIKIGSISEIIIPLKEIIMNGGLDMFLIPLLFFIKLFIFPFTLIGRRNETAADRYAVMYGYGDDLVNAFRKMSGNDKKIDETSILGKITIVLKYIKDYLMAFFFNNEHPTISTRIMRVENAMKEKYGKIYPNYAKEISKAFLEQHKIFGGK